MYFRDVINKLLGYAWHYACAHIAELTLNRSYPPSVFRTQLSLGQRAVRTTRSFPTILRVHPSDFALDRFLQRQTKKRKKIDRGIFVGTVKLGLSISSLYHRRRRHCRCNRNRNRNRIGKGLYEPR